MKRFSILFAVILPMLALFSLFSTFAIPSHALEVGGTISSDTTWTLANSPYTVTSDIIIDYGVTLTVEEGVEVIAQNGEYMDVYGHLVVNGSLSSGAVISGFSNLAFGNDGSGNINYAHIHPSINSPDRYGLSIFGNSLNPVDINNSEIQNAEFPIFTYANSIHRLQMDNVTFTDNMQDRVVIAIKDLYSDTFYGLEENVTLTPQLGLEGYEIYNPSNGGASFFIDNVTLTLDPGVTLIGDSDSSGEVDLSFGNNGHLFVNGSVTNTVTITGFGSVAFSGSATGDINHALIYPDQQSFQRYGVAIYSDDLSLVEINNSEIQNAEFPIFTYANSIHRLRMDNVTFSDNAQDRVVIAIKDLYGNTFYGLEEDVTLTPQPGLEGYEIYNPSNGGASFFYRLCNFDTRSGSDAHR